VNFDPAVKLYRSRLGPFATIEDFELWGDFVALRLSEAAEFDVLIEMGPLDARGPDWVYGGTDTQRQVIRALIEKLWDDWLEEIWDDWG
jgi:hypothetical protein